MKSGGLIKYAAALQLIRKLLKGQLQFRHPSSPRDEQAAAECVLQQWWWRGQIAAYFSTGELVPDPLGKLAAFSGGGRLTIVAPRISTTTTAPDPNLPAEIKALGLAAARARKMQQCLIPCVTPDMQTRLNELTRPRRRGGSGGPG
jgi:hypothetical protein